MRLPLAKIWRAFPELDRFDDAVCAQYVAEARRSRWVSRLVLLALLLPGGIIACVVGLGVSGALLGWLLPVDHDFGTISVIVIILVMLTPQVLILSSLFMVRDRWLRWAVRGRLETMACTACRYNLLGLTPIGEAGDQHVVCPECGRHVKLTPEMLEQLETLGEAT